MRHFSRFTHNPTANFDQEEGASAWAIGLDKREIAAYLIDIPYLPQPNLSLLVQCGQSVSAQLPPHHGQIVFLVGVGVVAVQTVRAGGGCEVARGPARSRGRTDRRDKVVLVRHLHHLERSGRDGGREEAIRGVGPHTRTHSSGNAGAVDETPGPWAHAGADVRGEHGRRDERLTDVARAVLQTQHGLLVGRLVVENGGDLVEGIAGSVALR